MHLFTFRYQDLNENSLPLTLQWLPADRKNFVRLLEKPLSNVWYNLTVEGVATCLDNLYRLKIHNGRIMRLLSNWAYVNVHLITPPLLLSYLNVFIQFTYIDKNIIRVMERCLQKSGPDVSYLLALFLSD